MDDDRRSGQERDGGRAAVAGAFGSPSRRSLAAVSEDVDVEIEISTFAAPFDWSEEKTARFDFDKSMLTPEDKLVVGYLIMEEHGLFAALAVDEQLDVVRRLRR
jgi:hypothetical protein